MACAERTRLLNRSRPTCKGLKKRVTNTLKVVMDIIVLFLPAWRVGTTRLNRTDSSGFQPQYFLLNKWKKPAQLCRFFLRQFSSSSNTEPLYTESAWRCYRGCSHSPNLPTLNSPPAHRFRIDIGNYSKNWLSLSFFTRTGTNLLIASCLEPLTLIRERSDQTGLFLCTSKRVVARVK